MKKADENIFLQKYKDKSPKEIAEILKKEERFKDPASKARHRGIKPYTIETVIKEALNRYNTGRLKYGHLTCPETREILFKRLSRSC